MNSPQAAENASSDGKTSLPQGRESFFDAQARNRRATWRMSVVCSLGATLLGVPLALIITPLIYGITLIVADLLSLFTTLPSGFWDSANEVSRLGAVALGWLLQQKRADPELLASGAAVMLLPGILLSFSIWLTVYFMFRRSGTGGALLALDARQPNPADLKELQLTDVVEEMAIAAGLPAPVVMLIDTQSANAVALGSSPKSASIIVTRGLVDELTRDELQAVLAHLIASIGNGDLRIALRMTSVLEVCGFLVALINAPFGPQSRHTLKQIVGFLLRGKSNPGEAAAVANLLRRSADLDTDDIDTFFDPAAGRSRLRSIRNFIFFPIFFTNMAVKLLLWFFSSAVLGPSLAMLWRTRQYLADASAVQLTRNPQSLASALQKLNAAPGEIPGGDWASHLFLASPRQTSRDDSPTFNARQKQMLAQAWGATEGRNKPASTSADFAQISKQFSGTLQAALGGDPVAIERVRVLYQNVATADPALIAQFPNPDDLFAARRGDLAAVSRLRTFRPRPESRQNNENSSGKGSISSFVDFHPPLKRRLKRLARLGAQVDIGGTDPKEKTIVLVLSLLLGPFAIAAVALLLLLIVITTLASLTFTVIWLAVIHKLFTFIAPVHN